MATIKAGDCQRELRAAGKPYPRTCPTCGLFGPCKFEIVSPPLAPDWQMGEMVPWQDFPPTPENVDWQLPESAPGRKGDWMLTYTGVAFYPFDPRPDEIRLDDIAAGLSKICRFGGQTIRWYSVAEHCVHMAAHAPAGLQLDALMHDATEAYLGDMVRPIKVNMQRYQQIEWNLERAIAKRFGLKYPLPAEIKKLDNAIIGDERTQVMAAPPRPWSMDHAPLGVTLRFWTPQEAAYQFISAFYRYGGKP
jgi:hypothetical protein